MFVVTLFFLLTSSTVAGLGTSRADDPRIAIRHDRADSAYVALGAQFPMVGKVGRNGGDGTLIAPTWVLTAAHVAEGMAQRTEGNVQVFFGDADQAYDVAQIIVHPDFRPMGPHDIALLRLAEAVPNITPAQLYTHSDENGKPIILVGHGDTKPGTGGPWVADRVKRGATNIIDAVTAQYIQFTFDAPPDGTDLEGTAGPGDSGGPAFIMDGAFPYVAGVSSLGEPGEKGPGTYGAAEHYVRVSHYQDWITQMLDDPPQERFVNLSLEPRPQPRERAVAVEVGPEGPGLPEDVVNVFGLLFREQGGTLRMMGRIDEMVPAKLQAAQIRPPAQLQRMNGVAMTSAQQLEHALKAIATGETVTLTFRHQGQIKEVELRK